jgi:hypothetical protein
MKKKAKKAPKKEKVAHETFWSKVTGGRMPTRNY